MEFHQKLDEYLSGELSKAEKQKFEASLQNNQELNEALSKQYLAREAIKLANIREQVKIAHVQNYPQNNAIINLQPKLKKSWISYISKIAASIAFVLMAWAGYQFKILSNETLLNESIIPYQEPNMRGENPLENKIKKEYINQNFQGVVELGSKSVSPSIEDNFLITMSNFNLKNYDTALTLINKQLATALSMQKYSYQLYYFKGLSLVGLGQYDAAISIFETIKNNQANPYSKGITNGMLLKIKLLALKN